MTREEVTAESQATTRTAKSLTTSPNLESAEDTLEDVSSGAVHEPPTPPPPTPSPLPPSAMRGATKRRSVVSVEAGNAASAATAGGGADDGSDKQCCFSCSKLSAFFFAADDDFPESEISNLRRRLNRQKIKIGICVLCTVAVELALGALSLNSRITSRGKWMAAKRGSGSSSGGGGGGSQHNSDEEDAEQSFESFIDSGLIEVILFAIPFMLVTNFLVLAAMWRNNVWFLLPWMVLHCIVIAFLALGAAILTAHDRALLGWIALIAAVFFLLCWKSIRVLFMKMVDWEVARADFGGGSGGGVTGEKRRQTEGSGGGDFKGSSTRDFSKAGNGLQREAGFGGEDEEDEADEIESAAYKEWNEEIFFGSKDRKFTRTISSQQSREQRGFGGGFGGGGSTFF